MKNDKIFEYQQERLSLITPLLHAEGYELRRLLNQIASDNDISVRTLKRYLERYQENGIKGLIPNYKGSGTFVKLYKGFDEALKRAIELRRQDPHISVRNIIVVLESEHPEWQGLLRRSTLQRHLQKQQVTLGDLRREEKCRGRKVFGRYRKSEILEQIQCDVKEFPRVFVNSQGVICKAYLQLWTDNHSRKILAFKLSDTQDVSIALDPLRTLVERYGHFDSVLTDNGSIYRSSEFERACRVMGISVNYCKPYSPEGKGMIERQNLAANEIEHQIENAQNIRLTTLVKVMALWIDRYNRTKSGALDGLSPDEVFSNSKRPRQFLDGEIISMAFRQTISRKVGKDGTISVNGTVYKVSPDGVDERHSVTLYAGYDGTVEQLASDGQAIRLHPFEIKGDVDFTNERKRDELSGPSQATPNSNPEPALPALIIALMREEARKHGWYKDEESFLREAREKFFYSGKEQPEQPPVKTGGISQDDKTGTVMTPSPESSAFLKVQAHKEGDDK